MARCHQQVFDLKKLLTTFVDELLTNRYRDIDPEIRSMVISTLGCCCNQLPTEFLTTNYLKHIAWALSDRVSFIRFIRESECSLQRKTVILHQFCRLSRGVLFCCCLVQSGCWCCSTILLVYKRFKNFLLPQSTTL